MLGGRGALLVVSMHSFVLTGELSGKGNTAEACLLHVSLRPQQGSLRLQHAAVL